MKILYIATERSDAQNAATALHGIAPNVTVLWASDLDHCADWIHENGDLAALVVDAQVDSHSHTSFLKRVHGLAQRAPVVVIAPEEAVLRLESLAAGACDFVAKNDSLFLNLPVVITRAIERAQKTRGERERSADLERKLAQAEAALQDAEQRHRSAMTTAAEQLAECQARYDVSEARAAATWAMVDEQVREAEIEVERARQSEASASANVDRLARRESELSFRLAEAAATHGTLTGQLAEAEAALEAANERTARERLTAAEQAAERQTAFQTQLAQEVEKRLRVETELARTVTARNDAEERHASAMTAAATELAARQRQFETDLAETNAARDRIQRQLSEAGAAIGEARQAYASATAEVERIGRREAELASQLAAVAASRITLERQLNDAAAAAKEGDERAARERGVATERLADLGTRLTAEIEKREALERELAETRAAAADTERLFREDAARLEDRIARERLDQESRLATAQEQLRTLALERDALDRSLGTMREQSQRLDAAHREERESLERARLAAEADVRRLAAEHTAALHSLESARRTFQDTLDRVSSEHAGAVATLTASVSERDAQLEDRAARHLASLQAAAAERRQLQDGFQTTLAARNREIERLQGEIEATIHELDVTRSLVDVLKIEADRVPQLREQLDARRAEIRQLFEHSPVALCRCTRDGALTHANGAFAVLAGYRRADQLRTGEFTTTVFESPDDLSWLIERCLSTRGIESVETTWRRRDGAHLVVRLSACASSPDAIEIVAEDLTNLHALQDRLAQAHRMEAVGRLASEVAVTCGNLLQDVHHDAQEWLTTVNGTTALRRQGEMLLHEVTRAAGFLRQLAAYSEEETSALAPVDLNRVLRDLEPVLKRVAGDDVELELPETSSPLDVDVKAERVERLLVNLAGYGRERMPLGGRLRIELATVVVDRRFAAQYPNVRQGPHALITVTEVGRTMRAQGPLQRYDGPTEQRFDRSTPERTGVDLGALQGLIRECSGHLWMAVEPPGDMVVKIHLPLGASNGRTHGPRPVIRSRRGHAIARWFQH